MALRYQGTQVQTNGGYFYDNRDNNDNGKDGRNGGCHEVTYNRDNKITVVNSFPVNLSTEQNQLVNYRRLSTCLNKDITQLWI